MAITQTVTVSFKYELLQGVHNFSSVGGDEFKMALYVASATLDADTTVYTTAGEVSSVGTNYPAGGSVLTGQTVSYSGTTAFIDFNDLTFPNVTLTARGALIYNATQGNKTVAVFDFGSDKTATDGDFTIIFPTPDATSAVIRLN